MKTNCVITIGRQFGSGGRYVGRMLAEKLGIPFYDKELLSEAAKQSGICEEIFEDHDEKPTRSLLFNLVTGMQVHGDAGSYYMDMPLNHKIFLAQFDAIRSIADKGPCVIVGRCADYILRDKYNCKVPTTFEELLALPGVGRKSANLIMGDVFCKPAIVTDTHCIRLCNKIGLVDGIKEPQKVEMALWKIIPPEEGSDLCHRFVMHGRAVCNARKPECEKCCLNDICRYAAENAVPTKETKEASV